MRGHTLSARRLVEVALVTATIGCAMAANASAASFNAPGPITIPDIGAASQYPSAIAVSGLPAHTTDVDVRVDGLSHTAADDLELVLVAPSGRAVRLMSDACGATPVGDVSWRFDDEAPAAMPDDGPCPSGSFRPSNFVGTGGLPAPAPASAAEVLSALDLANPNGTWNLYVADDESGDDGEIARGWSLEIGARPARAVGFAVPAITVAEGTALPATIVREAGPGLAGRVTFATAHGTASLNSDYQRPPGAWDLGADEVTKTLGFPIVASTPREGAETFTVRLSGASGDAAIDPARATLAVTIAADPLLPFATVPLTFRGLRVRGRGTALGYVSSLAVGAGLPTGTKIRVDCVRSCGGQLFSVARGVGVQASVVRFGRRVTVRPRTVLTVRATARGYVTRVDQFAFRVRGSSLTARRLLSP